MHTQTHTHTHICTHGQHTHTNRWTNTHYDPHQTPHAPAASSSRRGVAVAAAAATFPAPHHPQRLITRTMCQHANLSPDRRPRGGGDRGSPPSRDLRPLGRPATATGDEAHTDTRTCWAGQHGNTCTVEWLSAGIHAVCTWCNMNG